ncbi:hypothetical protein EON65_45175 [archaeon]|nr:MAG: hypothetical protein EON65_45175 [archaeon]
MQITVSFSPGSDRRAVTLNVEPSDSIESLINRVKYDRLIVAYHKLLFEGKQIDNCSTLADENIPDGSNLLLTAQTVFVKTLAGRVLDIAFDPSFSVKGLKMVVQRTDGIPPGQQKLIYCGRQLEDEHTLAHYNIQVESVIFLVLRLRGQGDCLRNHISAVFANGERLCFTNGDSEAEERVPVEINQIAVQVDNEVMQHFREGRLIDVYLSLQVLPQRTIVEGTSSEDLSSRTFIFTPRYPLTYSTTYKICASVKGKDSYMLSSFELQINTVDGPTSRSFYFSRPAIPKTILVSNAIEASKTLATLAELYFASFVDWEPAERRNDRIPEFSLLMPNGSLVSLTEDMVDSLRDCDVLLVRLPEDPQLDISAINTTQCKSLPDFIDQVPDIARSKLSFNRQVYIGAFCTVHECSLQGAGQVAVKVLRGSPEERSLAGLNAELQVLTRLRHPRLLILIGICRDLNPSEGCLGLVMEYMDRGSLHHCLHDKPEGEIYPTSLVSKLKCSLDIADGMRFLHASNIVHRDLKSANILVDADGRCKIADFGLSSFRETIMTHATGMVGTAAWTAPEVLHGEVMRPSGDVYCFGVILWEMMQRAQPWAGLTTMQIIRAVELENRSLTMPADEENLQSFPQSVRKILLNCLALSQDTRPSFDSLHSTLHQLLASIVRTTSEAAKDVPDCFICPITYEVMTDPVICADGHTYERAAITYWLQECNRSPKTNAVLSNRQLIPNLALRSAIEGYLRSSL